MTEGRATEFLLGGVHWDPTGTNKRTPDGHAQWAIDCNIAVAHQIRRWSGRGRLPEVELPPWGDHLAVRAGEIRTPPQLDVLQPAFPDRELRPYQRFGVAVLDPRSAPDVVAVTLDVGRPPATWRELDWHDLHSGRPLDLRIRDLTVPGAVVARTIRDLVWSWRSANDPWMAEVETPGVMLRVGVLEPMLVASDAEHLEPVGREGDQLLRYLSDPLTDGSDAINVYRKVDEWPETQAKAARIEPRAFMRLTGLPERTARAVRQNEPVGERTKRIVIAALRDVPDLPRQTGQRSRRVKGQSQGDSR